MNSVSSYRGKTNKQTERKLNRRLFIKVFKVILRFYLANGTHSLCFNLCFGSPQTPERTIKTLNFTFFILNLAWLTLGMCVFSLGWFFFFCLKAFWTTAQCGMSGYKNKCDLRQLWIMSLQSEAYSVNSIFTPTKLFLVAYKAKLSQHAFFRHLITLLADFTGYNALCFQNVCLKHSKTSFP